MIHFIFGTVWGWVGTAGLIVVAAIVVGYFFPSLRWQAVVAAAVAITEAYIYTKGSRDRAALEERRKEEAIKAVKEKYDEIDSHPSTPGTVSDELRNHRF